VKKSEYAKYLQSEHWQRFRKEQLAGAMDCERCNIPRWLAEIAYDQDLHLHHLNYACLGRETHRDVEILCRRCHELETFGRSELRAPKKCKCESCGNAHYNPRYGICQTCDDVFNSPWAWWVTAVGFEQPMKEVLKALAVVIEKRDRQ